MAKVSNFAQLSMPIIVPNIALTKKPISAMCACKIATMQLVAVKLNLSLLLLTPARARARAREKVKEEVKAGVDKLHNAMILSLTRLT